MSATGGAGGVTLVRRRHVCSDYDGTPAGGVRVTGVLRHPLVPVTSLVGLRTTDRLTCITYDDGPDPASTPRVLDALAEHDARATFFMLARAAEANPTVVARVVAEGHEIALHGLDHARLTGLPPRQVADRVREGRDRLEQVARVPVALYRPAYGAQTLGALLRVRALGLDVVIWSGWARDWERAPEHEVAQRAVRALRPGGILLLHDAEGDGPARAGSALVRARVRERVTRLLLARMDDDGWSSPTVSAALARYPAVRTVWAQSRRSAGPPAAS